MTKPSFAVRAVRRAEQALGFHPELPEPETTTADDRLAGRRALVVATNHGVLDVGKATGVFASELTAAYYAFADAGMAVDVASPAGGIIPVDPLSVRVLVRSATDDRFLADPELRARVSDSLAVADLDPTRYAIVYLAGGWGAAFDFDAPALAAAVTVAHRNGAIVGGVCHGPLGLVHATTADGRPLVAGRRVTGVSNRQVRQLGIAHTPLHPETELRRAGARYEARHRVQDVLANHWVVDGTLVTGQNQNAGPAVAAEMMRLVAERSAPAG